MNLIINEDGRFPLYFDVKDSKEEIASSRKATNKNSRLEHYRS
jgi:hypothetical protein